MSEPLLSAIVSTYASERYLRGCLDSLLAQTIADRLEIVVVDACSPEGEGAIVREYQQRFPRLRYVRTERREFTSEAFDRATAMARGRYLTTANADDRHRPDFAAQMVGALENHPEFGIVYADSLITHRDNETFAANTATRRYAWPDFTPAVALSCCLFGAQPVWRRAAHEAVGGWDPTLRFANDQDMFLRIALRFGAVHLAEALGLFLMRPDSTSGAANRASTLADVLTVMHRHRSGTALETIFPELAAGDDALARAAALVELGNLCALGPYTDAEFALACYRRATEQAVPEAAQRAVRKAFANNSACILAGAGAESGAERAFAAAGDGPLVSGNRQVWQHAKDLGRRPQLREFRFCEIEHPVVTASRRSRAIRIAANGQQQWSAPSERRPWDVFEGPNGVPIASEEKQVALPKPVPSVPRAAGQPHVLLVMYGWADSGGGTMLPRDVALELRRTGHRVTVFYAAAQPLPELPAYGLHMSKEAGVDLIGLCNRPARFMDLDAPLREIDDPAARRAFVEVLEAVRPDVVHFWNLHNLGMSLPAECKQRGVPTVLSSNNYWAICPRLYLVSERLQRCEGSSGDGSRCESCLGQSGSAAAHAERKAAGVTMLRDNIDVHLAVSTRVRELYVQNGDDPEHVRVLRQEPAATAELWRRIGSRRPIVPVLQRPLRVGFLGSVMAHKGVHVLVQAAQLLPPRSIECVALGDLAPDYHAWLQRLDKRGAVHFFGRYDQRLLPDLLGKFDVIVVPSVWDDCAPFVVAEALAARCPVVGSRIGGIPDFIEPGRNGLLFAPGDAQDLAACLHSFVRDARQLGRMQRAIQPPRGLPAFTRDLQSVYREVLAAPVKALATR